MSIDSSGWQRARLIPTSGINGQEEAERRATSALLAVMNAVQEFRVAMLKPMGAPAGSLEAFIEVPFKTADDRTVRPDGLFHVTRGKTEWVALVEVKTGNSDLEREQVETYVDIARDNSFPVVLTISNQLAPAPGVHPVEVDKRKLRKVSVHHLSWAEILSLAVQTRVHHGVSDPDQAWILGELIRYLEHPRSGAFDFSDMGGSWVAIRDSVLAGTLRANDKGVLEVASRWDQLLRFGALRLGRELGADVHVVVPRKEMSDPHARLTRHVNDLVSSGGLNGEFRIPDAIGTVRVFADLRAGQVATSVEVPAPQEGRPPTRVSWLVRQLKEAPAALRIEGLLVNTSATTSELLGKVREDPAVLMDAHRRDFRAFRITALSPLGPKRGTGRGSFIDSVLTAADGFYEEVVQGLRPWTAKAPQLPKSGASAVQEAGIDTRPSPDGLNRSDEASSGSAPAFTNTLTSQAPPPTFVTWERAEHRLDREREHERDPESGESPEAIREPLDPEGASDS